MSLKPRSTASVFQSMLPVRGATWRWRRCDAPGGISIHAPRAGSDPCLGDDLRVHADFNPRSPCGERRGNQREDPTRLPFQSTLPVRGATVSILLCGDHAAISIHAPRAGSDCCHGGGYARGLHFNPRSPCGERRQNQTKYGLYFGKIAEVSDRQQQRFGMYEVKHERLERLQGHFEKFRGANGRRIF